MPGTHNDRCAAVVVGRGPAGLTAAIALAKGGASTLLVGTRPAKPDNTLALARGAKTYQAGPGDSLGKIAAKFYGSSAKPLRDAIANANPSLKQNPDRILVGVTYTIPVIDTATTTPAPQPAAPLPALPSLIPPRKAGRNLYPSCAKARATFRG